MVIILIAVIVVGTSAPVEDNYKVCASAIIIVQYMHYI